MTCGFCHRLQKDGIKPKCDGIESVTQCPTNDVPKLNNTNRRFMDLFLRMKDGLFDGWGGCNYSAIATVLDLYEIPAGERPIILDKCLIVVQAVYEERERMKK